MSKPIIAALRAIPNDIKHFAAGDLLFNQGDNVQVLYLIETGSVRLVRHLSDGNALTLHRAGAGAILAEASLFSQSYHCRAEATVATRTRRLAKSALQDAMNADPNLSMAWAEYLAHEVQATRFRAEILAIRTVTERLNVWLANNGGTLPSKGEWSTLATEIGVSPEALYRELAKRRL